MTDKNTVFKTLSAINVNEHIKTKGKFSYLSWTYAWGELQKVYPESSYQFLEPVFWPDNTCEVAVNVTVEGVTRSMFLPVMDNRNNAVQNPNARQIGDARMRCLVKCIAMFGLGLYIYSGEDLPEEEKVAQQQHTHEQQELIRDEVNNIIELHKNNDFNGLLSAYYEVPKEIVTPVWDAIIPAVQTKIIELVNQG